MCPKKDKSVVPGWNFDVDVADMYEDVIARIISILLPTTTTSQAEASSKRSTHPTLEGYNLLIYIYLLHRNIL